MPVTDITTDPENLTMSLTADFAAPVDRLWHAFSDPRQLERFWGPPGWPATFTEFDFSVGGRARYEMRGPNAEPARGAWEFLRIDEGRGFEVIDSFVDADGHPVDGLPETRMVFDFEPDGERSRLRSVSYFDSLAGLEQVVAMGAVEGTRMALDQLDTVLQDLRAYAQGKGTQVELLDDTHVRITRLVDGPRELVWRAHHDPDLLKKWLLGPDGWTMTIAEPALAVGESFHYAWEQDGAPETAFGFEGEALLVEGPARVVTTERMSGTDGPSTLNDLQLYEENGATLLTVLVEYPDLETRDAILATGMTDGMEASYARLEEQILTPA